MKFWDRLAPQHSGLLIFCLIISAFFAFANLGNVYLNTDEAETAVLARNVLKFGLPLADDGRNLVQQNQIAPYKSEENKVWIFHPWLQFYLAAASFLIFGFGTAAARLPFALAGWAVIPVFYNFLKKHFPDKFIVNVSLLLLTFSIPFYLYIRQGRYYSLVVLFTLLTLDACLDLLRTGRGKLKFVICSLLLFYTNYASFFSLGLGLGIYSLIYLDKERLKIFLMPLLQIILLVLPGAFYLEIWRRKEVVYRGEVFSLYNVFARGIRYLLHINDYCLPLLLVLIILLMYKKGWLGKEMGQLPEPLKLLIIVSAATVGFYSLVAIHGFRHIIQVIPLFTIIVSYLLKQLYSQEHKLITVVIIGILLSGNWLHRLPYQLHLLTDRSGLVDAVSSGLSGVLDKKRVSSQLKFMNWKLITYSKNSWSLFDYCYELTHDYDGPIEGITSYLAQHAKQDEVVKITYGDLPLQFYLGDKLKIVSSINLENELIPDWWIFRKRRKWWKGGEKYMLIGKYRPLLQAEYDKIEIDYPEIHWENLPEPAYHKYRTVKGADKVVLYRRR